MDFVLTFYYKDLKQNCEHSAQIANNPPTIANKQNYEQTGVSEKRKLGRGDFCVALCKKLQIGGRQSLFRGCRFTLWRVPIYILEAELVLGVLYRKGGKLVKLFFSYSPPPRIHPPPPPTPLQGVENDRKRLEIDSLGGGSVVVGDESRGVGCS